MLLTASLISAFLITHSETGARAAQIKVIIRTEVVESWSAEMGNKLGKNKVYVVSGSGGRDKVDGARGGGGGGGSDMESEPDPDVNYSGPSPWSVFTSPAKMWPTCFGHFYSIIAKVLCIIYIRQLCYVSMYVTLCL